MPAIRYDVQLAALAARAFRKFDRPTQQRVKRAIDQLAADPRPSGVRKLEGEPNLYRVRSGDYRIIYTIPDRLLVVLVVAIGHRRDIYR